MVYDLSPGDVIHIGDAVTLTVLAVEGDLIRFGLETPERESADAGDVGKYVEASGIKQRRKGWEWN